MLEWANSKIWVCIAAELVSQPALLHPHYQGGFSSTVPASSPSSAAGKGQSQLSYSHALGTSSPMPTPAGPVLLFWCRQDAGFFLQNAMANEGQGQLSHSRDPRASSPAYRWQGTRSWEMASLRHPPTGQLTSCESAFLHLHPWGQLTCAPAEFRFLKYSCLRYLGARNQI